MACSPDGQRITSGSKDHTVQVSDALTRSNMLTYLGHTSDVRTVACSPDGQRIASESLELLTLFPSYHGIRQIILASLDLVQTSCGYDVPLK